VDGIVRGRATARVTGVPSPLSAAPATREPGADSSASLDSRDFACELVLADDLPDGLVVADRTGRVAVFNRAAARLTGIRPAAAIGQDVRRVLPLRDSDDRCWWTMCQPYTGLSTRTRHPERPLYMSDGTELLVSVGYVRTPRGRGPREGWSREPGEVQRIAITLRSAEQRMRLERSRADLVSTVAH